MLCDYLLYDLYVLQHKYQLKKMAALSASERLNKILENEGITIYKLSQVLDLPSTTGLYNIQKGTIKNITEDMAQRIKNAFPHYQTVWLRVGEGEMLKPETANSKEEPRDTFNTDNFDAVVKEFDAVVKGMDQLDLSELLQTVRLHSIKLDKIYKEIGEVKSLLIKVAKQLPTPVKKTGTDE